MKKDKILMLATRESIKEQAAWMTLNTSINTAGIDNVECFANDDEFVYYIEIQNGRVRLVANYVENIKSCVGFDQNIKDMLILEYQKIQEPKHGVVYLPDGTTDKI